ncbi:MAG TPA: hypothetical protein V6D11_33000 [Waterburya sp.]
MGRTQAIDAQACDDFRQEGFRRSHYDRDRATAELITAPIHPLHQQSILSSMSLQICSTVDSWIRRTKDAWCDKDKNRTRETRVKCDRSYIS